MQGGSVMKVKQNGIKAAAVWLKEIVEGRNKIGFIHPHGMGRVVITRLPKKDAKQEEANK
jgi:hypothetical protein